MRLNSLDEFAARTLKQIEADHRLRHRRVIEHWAGAEPIAHVDGKDRVVFCSNDYLGLGRDPRVGAAFAAAAERYGSGSGASHLVCGHHREHQALEEELAAFLGRERALLYSAGYMANLGVVGALAGRDDRVFEDRLNHASLIDAALLSRAELVRYPHADAATLDSRLTAISRGRAIIATDGVFSMDGDVAPLEQLTDVARRHDAWLLVDDAHGLGVIGAHGRGTIEATGVETASVPILVGTLGKAFGTVGAFVAGSHDLVELLMQSSRTFIYTTALPAAVAAATRVALGIVAAAHEERARLRAHIDLFRREATQLGLSLLPSGTPIQPIVFGSSERAMAASGALWERGLWVGAIRPPTVPEGTARLRVTLCASHTTDHVLQLIEALAAVARLQR